MLRSFTPWVPCMPLSSFLRFLMIGLLPAVSMAAAPADNPPLPDTHWTLQTLDGAPVFANKGSVPHLVLHASTQKLSGSAGCNRLQGRYTQRGTQLALTALASTRMACAPLLMQQEQRFIELLGLAGAYRIEGQTMSLLQGETVRLTFIKTAAAK
jgi:heat shock protein HslJ